MANLNTNDRKVFDDFPKVSCNDCDLYYTNQCDGVVKGSEKVCKAFIAVRGASIPKQIEQLQKDVKRLSLGIVLLSIALLIYYGQHLIDIFTK